MSSKLTKKQKPEDMLIRVIRVAEILAKVQNQPTQSSTTEANSNDVGIDMSVIRRQKTQR